MDASRVATLRQPGGGQPPFDPTGSIKAGPSAPPKSDARVEKPSVSSTRPDKTTWIDKEKTDLNKITNEVKKDELQTVLPLESLVQDISKNVPDFPTEIIQLIASQLQEKMANNGLKTKVSTCIGISLASALFNTLKDVYVACVATTPGAKTLCIVGILASLTSMATQIYTMCVLHNVKFDFDAVIRHIKDTVTPHLTGDEPCADISPWKRFQAWIPRIMTFIATSVAAGLSFLPKDSTIGSLIKNYGNSKKIGEDVSSVMSDFLTDVVGITLEGDPAYVDALVKLNAEGVVLLTTPMHQFHIDTKQREKLVSYPQRVDAATLHRTNNDTFKTLRMTLQSLQATRNQVVQRIQDLQDCSQRTLRQEPVGLYLAGMGGIGKSFFAKKVASVLAEECGYAKDVYCIDKCEQNFYEPYKGEAVGIANEFMGRRAENEPLLRDINKICSEDYFNFEGASLHTKNQPCHLKTVVLTSNVPNPDMTRVQDPNVTAAMWSRFRRFEVIDPRFASAEQARTNPNNLERGLHFLEFHEYHTDDSRNIISIKVWTADEVLQYVVKECRKREKIFLSRILADNPYNFDEAGIEAVKAKIAILDGLVPCARDGRVFTVRLEGPPGTGKTRFAEKRLIPTLLSTFPQLHLHRWSPSEPVPNDNRFYLVLVDDVLNGAEKEYFEMVKQLNSRSIIVLATDVELKPVRDWTSATLGRIPIIGSPFSWAPAVRVNSIPGVPNGFWRRIGISDRVKIGDTTYEPFSSDIAHFRFEHGFIIRRGTKQVAFETAEEEIVDKYIAYLQEAGDFIWSEKRLNIADPTVKIVARSYTDMVEVLSGKTGMRDLISCYYKSGTNKPDPRMQIFLDPIFMRLMFNRAGVEEWRVPDRPLTGPSRLHVAEKISAFLRKFKPDATVVVSITNPGLDDNGESTEPHLYELKGSVGFYTQASMLDPPAQITYDQNGVRIHATNETVSYEECAMIEAEHDLPSQYKPTTLRILRQAGLQHPNMDHARLNYRRRRNFAEEMTTERVRGFFKHPAVVACMSILGVCVAGGIIYGIYKACSAACSEPDKTEPYGDSNDSNDGKNREMAAKALRKGSPPKNSKGQTAKFFMQPETRTQAEIDEWTNNFFFSLPGVQPYQEEFKHVGPNAKKILSDLAKQVSLKPASIAPGDELKVHYDPKLKRLMERVKRNLVTIHGNGSNYGLVLEGDVLMTTAHTVAGLETARVTSREFTGTAKVVRVSVPRDLAILQLIRTDNGRAPQQFPSIRKHLFANLTHLDCLAWFVKPFDETVFVCGKMLSTPSYTCFSSYISETFNPSEWIITFFQHHMSWSPTIFQKGECGLPLFVEVNGEYKICGILNAVNQERHVTFASVSAADFNNTRGITPASAKICQRVEYKAEESGVPAFVANEFVVECLESISLGNVTHVEAGYPDPLGHCVKLRSHSYPKHKARCLVPNDMSAPGGLENTQKLSCVAEHLSPDIDLPRRSRFIDGKRVPHSREPLFVQIQKYNKAPGFTADRDVFSRAIREVIHSYRLRMGVSNTSPLKILSVKECLNGIRNGALGGFSRDTGSGPTLKAKFNIMEKRDVLYAVVEDPPVYVLAENAPGTWVKNSVSEKIASLMNGVPVLMLTKACKKVEKIDRESWEKAKVRLFTECDFEDNIVLKMLFGDLQNRLAQSANSPVLLNMNSYLMAPQVAELMGHNLDNLVGTDISSMDKHFPPEMIAAFVQVCGALYNWPLLMQRAIACTLMFPLQTFEGDVFTSKCGNLSGWFPTSLINCVAQELIIAYDRLKNLEGPAPFDILKSGAEPYAILGDDKIQRLTPARARAQEKSYLECGFVMQAGSKLQNHEERFCSRVIYKQDGLYYGALKLSSISGLIYYASSSDLEVILPGFSLALFEASLHQDPEIYDKTLVAIQFVANYNNIALNNLASREHYREIYEHYVTGFSSVLNFCGHRPDILSILEHCNMADNARMSLNQYAQQIKQAPPVYSAKMDGPAHSPTWTVDLSFMGESYRGVGESKTLASERAAKAAIEKLSVTPANGPLLVSEHQAIKTSFFSTITECEGVYRLDVHSVEGDSALLVPRFFLLRKGKRAARRAARDPGFERVLDALIEEHLKYAQKFSGPVCVWHDRTLELSLKDEVTDNIRYKVDEHGDKYVLSATLQKFLYSEVVGALEAVNCFGAPENHRIYYIGGLGPCNGPDTPIQPENIQQATLNTGALTIPQMSNPQPSGQAPSLAPPAEKIVSALEGITTETLNPLGPPNMLAVGAVVFDIKDLVYSQFLDCDQQFVITDDTPPGSILLQIPYDPLGEWVNPYIRQYVGQHERFTGSLLFRMTIVGNPTFSGLIGVAWQPRRVLTPTTNVSEMQKFSYYGATVELPSNKVIVLNDARQDRFWRSTLDESDIDSRPHLVIFTLMSIVSPLREGIQTRIRIASKLSNGGIEDGIGRNAFQASLPVMNPTSPVGRAATSQTLRLADLVPSFNGQTVYMCTDGIAFSGRGDSFLQQERSYCGTNDQAAQYKITFPPGNNNFDVGIDQVELKAVDIDRQTFSLCGVIQDTSVPTQGDAVTKTTRTYAFYESNNLPQQVYRDLRARIFADRTASGTVYQQVQEYVSRLENPTTYTGLDLIGIYYSPQQNFNSDPDSEFRMPTGLIQDISWYISSGSPPSQIRLGLAMASGSGTFYGMKLVFKQGIMVIYVTVGSTLVSVGSGNSRGPQAVSTNNLNNHSCSNNPLWKAPFPTPAKSHFPPWTVEAEATNVQSVLLPAGWSKLSITRVNPSVVIPSIFTPTLLSSGDLEKALARRSVGLSASQCLAFDILDPVSNRRICSARYLQESGDIVCNVPTTSQNNIYSAYPGNVSEALLSNLGPVERSNAFVLTDTSNWLTRKSTAMLTYFGLKAPQTITPKVSILDMAFGEAQTTDATPTASMAAMAAMQMGGGMLSGIGSGLTNMANQRHEQNMQGNKFAHETNMLSQAHSNNMERDSQGHSYNLERDSQNHMFELERMLENFGYTNQLQAQQFQHNSDMSRQNFQQQQAMMFASAPSRTLLGGSTRGTSFA